MDITKIQKAFTKLFAPSEEKADHDDNKSAEPEKADTEVQTSFLSDETTVEASAEYVPEPKKAPVVKMSSKVKIFFTNNIGWDNVYFYLYNTVTSEEALKWPGVKLINSVANSLGELIYTATADTDKFNRVIFNNGCGEQTVNIPLCTLSSGFYVSSGIYRGAAQVGIYANEGSYSGKRTVVKLPYPDGTERKVSIWTPADYKPDGDCFRTVYLTDAQNLFNSDQQDAYGGWRVTDAVEGMIYNGGRGAIIVGIDNSTGTRDSELTPDLGEVTERYATDFAKRTGSEFADFIINTVMPYVWENYNSGRSADDNFIVGSSSGGLEAFYIGLEHRDRFSAIGALSPAFLLFGSEVWDNYLGGFDFSSPDMPKLYIYNGNGEYDRELLPAVEDMHLRLLKLGYPYHMLRCTIEDNAAHNEAFWRIMFPEALSWFMSPDKED